MTDRPFRHLCPEADERDAMTDEQFWGHVFTQPDAPDQYDDYDDTPDPFPLTATPCPVCGQLGACSYDDQGLPLIHAVAEEDES